MTKINIDRMAEERSASTSVYTPLIEAIVNSIEAIKDKGASQKDGWIRLKFFRNQSGLDLRIDGETVTPRITSVEITDNGVGFTEDNFNSFDMLHSDYKMSQGGKGFGRVFYRQYFKDVHIESFFQVDGKYFFRSFDFTKTELVENHEVKEVKDPLEFDEPTTTVFLNNIKPENANKLELRLETIARKLLEHLLIYFVDEKFKCPRITLIDDQTGVALTINDTLEKSKEIVLLGSDPFNVKSEVDGKEYSFIAKTFKIFYSRSSSAVYLTAHQRQVTKSLIHEHINEYKEGFTEVEQRPKGQQVTKNYIAAVYVIGDFLDKMVSTERGAFLFSERTLGSPLTTKEIELKAVEMISKYFETELIGRTDRKKTLIAAHVTSQAPWLRKYVADLDLQAIAYNPTPEDINSALESVKFKSDGVAKKKIRDLINAPPEKEEDIKNAINSIQEKVLDIGKEDLAQYVVLRKAVLDLFNQALKWDEDKKYKKEDAIHSMIFPMRTTSDDIDYEQHNLWMVDERLSFHSYAASDLPLEKKGDRPDILVLDHPILVRDETDSTSTPITIVEFKRPYREDYKDDKYDPLRQISRYVDQIRSGKAKHKDGTYLSANENTPAYGYVICDLTEKIERFCRDAGLVKDPDGEGYHGFHPNWKIYFEVVSFKKLHKNAELRNKILFKKLDIQ
ncbi:MAG TPA: ATP-binding protein [Candidatus Saccharimonadales bacterium]|nr:ATP-binding protein [Candidatus Saccharimonadales bacterium]